MESKKTALSVLIPVYNSRCVDFVRDLQLLVDETGINYEIIVADDASTDRRCVEANRELTEIPHCIYIIKEVNTGAAATRNFLAQQSSYPYLLFVDCDMQLADGAFFRRYLDYLDNDEAEVVSGGVRVTIYDERWHDNLRFLYEEAEQANHTAEKRRQRPYQSFRSANFLIRRDVMLRCPFDERFRRSGYEDVLFGKQLRQHHINIAHIENPLVMGDFESNADYVSKVEHSLQTLYQFRGELQGYSRLLTTAEGIHLGAVRWMIAAFHRCFGGLLRRNLCGHRPNLNILKIYKLGFYLNIS